MKTRRLGKTELQVSEIGFGGEWLERHPEEESIELIHYASSKGINILDCWMPDPKSRNIIGEGIKENRDKWFIQGHIGSTWKDEQYYRTREMEYVRPAFEDLLKRLQTDYIDLGMIHYVDSEEEWDDLQQSEYMDYVMELKRTGVIRHIGMSSHNPKVAKKAAESGYVEMILFSINPAFDMLPASENIDTMFAEEFDSSLKGIDADRARLYKACEENDVGITVMKGFAGGRLFDEKRSPFGVSLTPVQKKIHPAFSTSIVEQMILFPQIPTIRKPFQYTVWRWFIWITVLIRPGIVTAGSFDFQQLIIFYFILVHGTVNLHFLHRAAFFLLFVHISTDISGIEFHIDLTDFPLPVNIILVHICKSRHTAIAVRGNISQRFLHDLFTFLFCCIFDQISWHCFFLLIGSPVFQVFCIFVIVHFFF